MNAQEVLDRVRITDVAQVLGIEVRKSRCRAVWRPRADGRNVALCDSKGTWFDHARGEGGGVLDFIARVRGCDRRGAVQWLANYARVPLNEQNEAQRREWARRMRAARPAAETLAQWKLGTLEALRSQRNLFQRIYHNAVQFVLRHGAEECDGQGDIRYELALSIGETYWPRVEEYDSAIDRLEAAPYADLLVRFGAARSTT